jgi:hypothetical protein
MYQDACTKVAPYVTNVKVILQKGHDRYEIWRGKLVKYAQNHAPKQAGVIERLTRVVPDTLVFISVSTHILTFPALLYSCGRVLVKISPEVKKFSKICLEHDIDEAAVKEFKSAVRAQCNDLFEKVIVPAALVGFVFDAVFSICCGLATRDAGQMLRGLVFDIPGAVLAWRYLEKKVAEEPTPVISNPEVKEAPAIPDAPKEQEATAGDSTTPGQANTVEEKVPNPETAAPTQEEGRAENTER